MSNRLSNYLKTYRKHAGLTQRELASLLGKGGPDTISRYESGDRTPELETILAYQAALDVPARELFAGTYEKVEQQVVGRAEALADELDEDGQESASSRKLEHLKRVSGRAATEPNPASPRS